MTGQHIRGALALSLRLNLMGRDDEELTREQVKTILADFSATILDMIFDEPGRGDTRYAPPRKRKMLKKRAKR